VNSWDAESWKRSLGRGKVGGKGRREDRHRAMMTFVSNDGAALDICTVGQEAGRDAVESTRALSAFYGGVQLADIATVGSPITARKMGLRAI